MLDNDTSGRIRETSLQIEEGKAIINIPEVGLDLGRLIRETIVSFG